MSMNKIYSQPPDIKTNEESESSILVIFTLKLGSFNSHPNFLSIQLSVIDMELNRVSVIVDLYWDLSVRFIIINLHKGSLCVVVFMTDK
jgi:hypothetical protein